MSGEKYRLTNRFSLFYDIATMIPMLDSLKPTMSAKIKQLIWNKAYDHSTTDFKTCGKNDEYRFFIIKNPSIKISYRDCGNHWIVYSLAPYNP